MLDPAAIAPVVHLALKNHLFLRHLREGLSEDSNEDALNGVLTPGSFGLSHGHTILRQRTQLVFTDYYDIAHCCNNPGTITSSIILERLDFRWHTSDAPCEPGRLFSHPPSSFYICPMVRISTWCKLYRPILFVVLLGTLWHFFAVLAMFDIYFKSPVVYGMSPHKINVNPPAKRLVLLVGAPRKPAPAPPCPLFEFFALSSE